MFCSGHDHRHGMDCGLMACGPLEICKYHKETAVTKIKEWLEIAVLITAMTAWVWYWYEIVHA